MKFTVEVEDFWLDEEELSDALTTRVKNDVVYAIKESIKEQVNTLMDKIVKEEITSQLEPRIRVLMEEFLSNGMVRDRYNSSTSLTIPEFLAKNFEANNDNILKYIKQESERQGADLKRRYDLLFASQIVAKINEQGLLKEDVARLLLPNTNAE